MMIIVAVYPLRTCYVEITEYALILLKCLIEMSVIFLNYDSSIRKEAQRDKVVQVHPATTRQKENLKSGLLEILI